MTAFGAFAIRTWTTGCLALAAGLGVPLSAQSTDSTRAHTLLPVSVSVTRDGTRSVLELPFALTRVTLDSLHPGLRRSSVGELLFGIPGVQVQERNNPSQDPRLAIRGFGARSAFGVRGVRVLRDGIPVTLPDGQTPVDWLDLETAGSVEVIRGTAASLYGNAAGGVLSIRSRAPSAAPLSAQFRAWNGGNQQRLSLQASGSGPDDLMGLKETGWMASATKTEGDGARDYSKQKSTSVFARTLGTVMGTQLELAGARYEAPRAENPGALTATELVKFPRLADSLNITKRARKAVEHSLLSLMATHTRGENEINGSLFIGTRSLDNPQAFAIVGVDRKIFGGSLRGSTRRTVSGIPMRLSAGFDTETQHDDRANYENCADVPSTTTPTTKCPVRGQERGAYRLNQEEDLQGQGAFVRYELEGGHKVLGSVSLRYDRVHFDLTDHFIAGTNGDDSGDRTMTALSPMAGIVLRVRPLFSLYMNVASAFETPTITELTNQPDGKLGLNKLLDPQRTQTVEVGGQGIVGAHLRLDGAVFLAKARDELISFDVPEAPGRRAFHNAGRTRRTGLEGNATMVGAWGEAGAAYTWSHFRFTDYALNGVSYNDNPIPGVPEHQAQAYATFRWRGWYATGETNLASRTSVDDAKTTFADKWTTVGMRVGMAPSSNRFALEPVIGVDNIFNKAYAGSVVINATRGRFFEPGVVRRVYGGVRMATTPWRQ